MNKLKLQQTFNKYKFKTIKNSPQILMYAGAIGVVVSGVLACKATLKLTGILEESRISLNKITEVENDETINYTNEDARKDKAIVYTSTALDIAKIYSPSIILGGVSIVAMIQSHNILNRRNAALAAAFATVSESFSKYRKAVVDKYGERADYEFKHGIRSEKIEVEETDENGKTKKKKVSVDVIDGLDGYSDYARFYDDGCVGWEKDPDYNKMFLKAQQQYANDRLVAQGYLFLNDVYRMLGIPDSKAGQIVGWTYDPENPKGDNYVDFGIFDVSKENSRDFVNGYEATILLDFNVDGNVWEYM
jgi:hypothetical protein